MHENSTIHYLVCFYFGERRSKLFNYEFNKNKLFCLENHVNFLKTCGNKIKEATFVVNGTVPEGFYEYLNSNTLENVKINIKLRENIGYSYAAYNEIITENLKNYINPDYYFLIEDDYIPISKDFYEPFLNLMTDTNVFVCCYKNYIWQNPTRQHPAISNGLLKNEACKNVFNKHGLLFQYFGLSFGDACWAQEEFFSYFEEFNYEFCDILENYNMPFHNAIDDNYISYGKPEGEILINSILKDLV